MVKRYNIPGYGSYTNRELNALTMDEIFDILQDLGVVTQSIYQKYLTTPSTSSLFWPVSFVQQGTPVVQQGRPVVQQGTRPTPARRTANASWHRSQPRAQPGRLSVNTSPLNLMFKKRERNSLQNTLRQRQPNAPIVKAPKAPPPMLCSMMGEVSCENSSNCYWTGSSCITG